jgi:hypothetical protein
MNEGISVRVFGPVWQGFGQWTVWRTMAVMLSTCRLIFIHEFLNQHRSCSLLHSFRMSSVRQTSLHARAAFPAGLLVFAVQARLLNSFQRDSSTEYLLACPEEF